MTAAARLETTVAKNKNNAAVELVLEDGERTIIGSLKKQPALAAKLNDGALKGRRLWVATPPQTTDVLTEDVERAAYGLARCYLRETARREAVSGPLRAALVAADEWGGE